MPSCRSPLSSGLHPFSTNRRQWFVRGWRRQVLCLVLIFGLLTVPDAGYAVSAASSLAMQVAKDTVAPLPVAVEWFKRLFRRAVKSPQQETLAERIAQVAQLQISPRKYVGYLGQTVGFTALAFHANGETLQGVRYEWESSDNDKVQIDDAGRARLLQPGLVQITCHAGSIKASVPLLVRPTTRPRQSDADWNSDQQGLREPKTSGADTGSGVGQEVAALLDHLVPTAQAQAGWTNDLGYDELWNDPRNLVGTPSRRATEGTRIGAVLPEGSNFNFAAPIIGLGGRGLGASLMLYYNSRLWSRRNNSMAYNAIVGWPAPGFSLGFGRIVTYDISAGGNPTCKYMLIDADGTRHYLGSGSWAGFGYALGGPFETNDGSHIVYTGNGRDGGDLHYADGTMATFTMVNNRLLPTTIQDRNGNYVQVAYKPDCVQVGNEMYCEVFAPMAIDYLIDTMGRTIQFNYDTNYRLTSITAPGYGGTAQNPVTQTIVQFDYQTVTANGTFSGLTVERGPGILTTLKHIYFPATGKGYIPNYSVYGIVTSMSARRQMSIGWPNVIQDGVESNNISFNYPTSGPLTDAPAFTQRTESAVNALTSVYTYASSTNSLAQTKTFTITRPDNSTFNLTRSTNASSPANGLLVQSEIKNSSGASMSKAVMTYVMDGGGEPQVQTLTTYDDGGTPTKVDYDYDSYGNATNTREYGFQVSGQWQVRRRTRHVYKTDTGYVTYYLRNLVIETDVYDAQLNTSDADDVLVAKTTITYDDYQAMGGMAEYRDPVTGQLLPIPPGHLSWYDVNYTLRGNVTGTTQWYDLANNLSITRLRKIDIFGNTVAEQVACCNQQTVTFSDQSSYAFPDAVTKGSGSGPQLTTRATYDFNTSATSTMKDANNLTTTVNSRDAALRPTWITYPTGESVNTYFNDSAMSATKTVTYLDGATQKNVTVTTVYDGFDRVIQEVDANGGQVNTTYDAMGRVASQTNPFTAGGTPGPAMTFQYDALDRKTLITLPDTQTIATDYNGGTVTMTDQVNRKTQRVTDGFGRLVTLYEQDAAGQLSLATTYSYDILGNLTQINQGSQIRAFKYDSMGRRTFEKLPEQTPTIADGGVPNQWTTAYTYTPFNGVATRRDARGVITTYTYDSLNRVTQISYNTVSGVTTAPTLTFMYDTDVAYNTTALGKLVRVNIGSDYQERYTFDQTAFRITSTIRTIGSRTYTTGYGFNEEGQLTQLTYPSSRSLTLARDSKGRLNALSDGGSGTNYVSNVNYTVTGQISSFNLGNGVAETFGFDTQRMQMTSQTATKGANTLLSLNYGYQASAGQMGAGTTAGNASQLVSVTGSINGSTESATYTYDNLARLVTSSETSNGVSAQQRFVYDRWGNRTGVWDATSGGNQIQTVALEQSGGVPTNRIQSVTAKTTLTYTYDAAGNLTSDGLHTYTYDSANRLVSVDGGSTAAYSYDHQNQRYKKTVGSTVTHYLWHGMHVIAEHNGATGAVLADYIYAGDDLIAKVAGTVQYFLRDRLGIRVTLDASGTVIGKQAHQAFGEDFAESGTQEKHHFTSYERDGETGLDYAVNRHNQSATGRFVQVDRNQGDLGKPQSFNKYTYSRNDPKNLTDPTGLFVICARAPSLGFTFGFTFLLDGVELPEIIWSIPIVFCIVIFFVEPPPKYWTGFNQGQIDDIEEAFSNAFQMLGGHYLRGDKSKCKNTLRDKGIDVGRLSALLLTISIKHVSQDPRGLEHGPWRVFNGATSDFQAIRDLRNEGTKPAAAVRGGDFIARGGNPEGDIFLMPRFFEGNSARKISLSISQAIVLMHEVIHLTGKNDEDFAPGKGRDAGSRALSDLIIKNCYSPLYGVDDLAFNF